MTLRVISAIVVVLTVLGLSRTDARGQESADFCRKLKRLFIEKDLSIQAIVRLDKLVSRCEPLSDEDERQRAKLDNAVLDYRLGLLVSYDRLDRIAANDLLVFLLDRVVAKDATASLRSFEALALAKAAPFQDEAFRAYRGTFRANLARAHYMAGDPPLYVLRQFDRALAEGVASSAVLEDIEIVAESVEISRANASQRRDALTVIDNLAARLASHAGLAEGRAFVQRWLSRPDVDDLESVATLQASLIGIYATHYPGLEDFRKIHCPELVKGFFSEDAISSLSARGFMAEFLAAGGVSPSCDEDWDAVFRLWSGGYSSRKDWTPALSQLIQQRLAALLFASARRAPSTVSEDLRRQRFLLAFALDQSLVDAIPFVVPPSPAQAHHALSPIVPFRELIHAQLRRGPPQPITDRQAEQLRMRLGELPSRLQVATSAKNPLEGDSHLVVSLPPGGDRLRATIGQECRDPSAVGTYQTVDTLVGGDAANDARDSHAVIPLSRHLAWGDVITTETFDRADTLLERQTAVATALDYAWGRFRWHGRAGYGSPARSAAERPDGSSFTGSLAADFAIKPVSPWVRSGCPGESDRAAWGLNAYAESGLRAYPVTSRDNQTIDQMRWGPESEIGIYSPLLLRPDIWSWNDRGSRIAPYIAPIWKGGLQGAFSESKGLSPAGTFPAKYFAFGVRTGYLRVFRRLPARAGLTGYRNRPAPAPLAHVDLLAGKWESLAVETGPSTSRMPWRFEAKATLVIPRAPVALEFRANSGPRGRYFQQNIVFRFEFSNWMNDVFGLPGQDSGSTWKKELRRSDVARREK